MKVFKVNETATLPEFKTKGSACFDLSVSLTADDKIRAYNPHNREMFVPVKMASNGKLSVQLQPQFRTLVPTGLIFDIPENMVLKFFIRSGVALKYGLMLANDTAIIDSDYVDPSFIMIYNSGDTPVILYDGERIAQGRLEKNLKYTLEETLEKPQQKTDRDGGLGSTGI